MDNLAAILRQMLKSGVFLTLFAVTGSALLAITYYLTLPYIEENRRQSLFRNLNQVIPAGTDEQALLDNAFSIQEPALGHDSPQTAYQATRDNEPVAIILPVTATDGYSGPIDMIVGIDMQGQLTGVRVVSHKETPGLGDAIDTRRSDWIFQFTGLSLDNPALTEWAVTKDGGHFDSFTGATITPRAVVSSIKNALIYFNENKEQMFEQEYRLQNTDYTPL